LRSAGEGAALEAKEFALEKFVRKAGAVDLYQRLFG
jgi:hypothetical protein